MPSSPHLLASRLAEAAEGHFNSLSESQQASKTNTLTGASAKPISEETEATEYISKIGILASSVPYYHNQYMEKRKSNYQMDEGEPLEPHETALVSNLSLDINSKEQSTEEQAATVMRLKPHSRSTLQLQNITSKAAKGPEEPDQADKKKSKSIRWQFGIRSRNSPLDAMLCIYRALAAQGAEWHVPPPKHVRKSELKSYPGNSTGLTNVPSNDSNNLDSTEKDQRTSSGGNCSSSSESSQALSSDGGPLTREPKGGAFSKTDLEDSEDDDNIDPNIFPPGYLPKDPWVIHVRWRKDGLFPPGTIHSSSAHSSRIDLGADDHSRRRPSIIGSLSSAAASTSSVTAIPSGAPSSAANTTDSACYVYMDVQLYMVEPDCYLVDFKCAGYETIVETMVGESKRSSSALASACSTRTSQAHSRSWISPANLSFTSPRAGKPGEQMYRAHWEHVRQLHVKVCGGFSFQG